MIVGVWRDLDLRYSGDVMGLIEAWMHAWMHGCMAQDAHGRMDSSQIKVDIGVIDLFHYHSQWHLTFFVTVLREITLTYNLMMGHNLDS